MNVNNQIIQNPWIHLPTEHYTNAKQQYNLMYLILFHVNFLLPDSA